MSRDQMPALQNHSVFHKTAFSWLDSSGFESYSFR
jgi:hypothetical protein